MFCHDFVIDVLVNSLVSDHYSVVLCRSGSSSSRNCRFFNRLHIILRGHEESISVPWRKFRPCVNVLSESSDGILVTIPFSVPPVHSFSSHSDNTSAASTQKADCFEIWRSLLSPFRTTPPILNSVPPWCNIHT